MHHPEGQRYQAQAHAIGHRVVGIVAFGALGGNWLYGRPVVSRMVGNAMTVDASSDGRSAAPLRRSINSALT